MNSQPEVIGEQTEQRKFCNFYVKYFKESLNFNFNELHKLNTSLHYSAFEKLFPRFFLSLEITLLYFPVCIYIKQCDPVWQIVICFLDR